MQSNTQILFKKELCLHLLRAYYHNISSLIWCSEKPWEAESIMISISGMKNSEAQRDGINGQIQLTQVASDKARSRGSSHPCACSVWLFQTSCTSDQGTFVKNKVKKKKKKPKIHFSYLMSNVTRDFKSGWLKPVLQIKLFQLCVILFNPQHKDQHKGLQLALDVAWGEEKEGDTRRKVKERKLEIRLERIAH